MLLPGVLDEMHTPTLWAGDACHAGWVARSAEVKIIESSTQSSQLRPLVSTDTQMT